MNNPKQYTSPFLKELTVFLISRGVSNQEIEKIITGINAAAAGKFYTEIVANLTEEESKELDQCVDQEQANAKLRDFVYEKTGKNADFLMAQYIDAIAEEVYKEARLRYPPQNSLNGQKK